MGFISLSQKKKLNNSSLTPYTQRGRGEMEMTNDKLEPRWLRRTALVIAAPFALVGGCLVYGVFAAGEVFKDWRDQFIDVWNKKASPR